MILRILFPVLLCSLYSSAQMNAPPPPIVIKDDKDNWKDLFKEMPTGPLSRSDNINIFDKILRANIEERGKPGSGRSDDNIFLFEGDINMPKSEVAKLLGASQGTSRQKRAVMRKTRTNLWRKNIKYVIASSLGSRAKTAIFSAVREWQTTLSCMGRWTDVTRQSIKPRDYMYFFQGGGCYSQVGRVGGAQRVSIGRGCDHHGIVVHEIGHAMGLWHEQSRPDRNRFVNIHWGNIIPAMKFNFQKHSTTRINSFNVGYDYGSIMHYGATAFRARGRYTITTKRGGTNFGQRRGLSKSDKKQVQILYGCKVNPTKPKPKPTGCRERSSDRNWCMESKKRGLCTYQLFKSYMSRYCCHTCRSVSSCRDKGKFCGAWKKQGYCTDRRYRTYMKKNCSKTCGVCRT